MKYLSPTNICLCSCCKSPLEHCRHTTMKVKSNLLNYFVPMPTSASPNLEMKCWQPLRGPTTHRSKNGETQNSALLKSSSRLWLRTNKQCSSWYSIGKTISIRWSRKMSVSCPTKIAWTKCSDKAVGKIGSRKGEVLSLRSCGTGFHTSRWSQSTLNTSTGVIFQDTIRSFIASWCN